MADVHNEFTGSASGVVQAGVVHGGVHVTAIDAPPAVIPHQLPAPGLLTGRATLLEQLDTSLLPQGVAVLTGMAGVGKTALVLHWADHNSAAFPDGQLYADLRGFGTDEPMSPNDALAGFMRALGHARPEEFTSVEERAAHFRTLMSERKVLLVLDNAHSVEHVRPLLPGAGPCSVVVISRHQLRGLVIHHPASVITVGPLAEADGLALLNKAAGSELDGDAAAQLVRYCGGLPLALRIVAERLADAPDDITEVVSELADERARLDALDTQDDARSAIRTVFSWSYRGLPAQEARAFRVLGLHPTTEFSTDAATALLGLDRSAATRTLRSLVQRHLLLSVGRGRFGVHDLLHTYAAEICESHESTNDKSCALRMLFDHYLHSADLAGRRVMPHRLRLPLPGKPRAVPALDNRQQALNWFEMERRNLEAMCVLDAPAYDERIWLLAYTLRDYYFLDKLLDGWRGTHEKALAAAIRAGDPLAAARTRNNLGMALVEAGLLDDAEIHYSEALRLFEQLGDGHGRANALANLAAVLRRRGRFTEALSKQQLALDWYRSTGASRNIGITLRSMALAMMELEQYDKAIRHVQEALDVALTLGLDLDAAEGFGRLGRIQQRAGDYAAAEVALCRAVHHSRRCGSRHEEARALRLLGDVAAFTGRTADARRWWLDALRVYQLLDSSDVNVLQETLDALPDDQ